MGWKICRFEYYIINKVVRSGVLLIKALFYKKATLHWNDNICKTTRIWKNDIEWMFPVNEESTNNLQCWLDVTVDDKVLASNLTV